jgi:hypothetical protein
MPKKTTFSATVINPASVNDEGDPTGVNLNNFYSVMNKSGACYLYIPCRDFGHFDGASNRLRGRLNLLDRIAFSIAVPIL